MGFYGSNDPTNNVKALKEDSVLRIRLQSHHVHSTALTILKQLLMQFQLLHNECASMMLLNNAGINQNVKLAISSFP